MEESCRQALKLGLPGIAFTDHADFARVHAHEHELDVAGYLESVERCRAAFPALRILSGVELGEPHRFPDQTAAVLGAGTLDRVLGSVHCIWEGDSATDMSQFPALARTAPARFRTYLAETLTLVSSSQPFQVLAHLDYPKRYWPHGELEFRASDFEEEIRAVLRATIARGSVLEVNTTRGMEPGRGLCPGPEVIGWWYQMGGAGISFGSDAHAPDAIAAGFGLAAEVVEAVGFRPSDDPLDFWRR